MLTKRIIPCLDIKDGQVVKGINFVNLRDAGSPVELASKYYREGADELVFLDITATDEKRKTLIKLVEEVAKAVRIPFTVGGGISTLEDIEFLLKAGADKVSLNSAIVRNPELIREASKRFGSQAIVAAIDTKNLNGKREVFINGGKKETGIDAFEWCIKAADLGAGELLITSMDTDGRKEGYDISFLARVTESIGVPVIASGGAGSREHFLDVFKNTGCGACLAASLFHFEELTIKELKKYLNENGIGIRV